jgi:hypothetical protein
LRSAFTKLDGSKNLPFPVDPGRIGRGTGVRWWDDNRAFSTLTSVYSV